jgi:steroid 5-alpha reductase family enzyme
MSNLVPLWPAARDGALTITGLALSAWVASIVRRDASLADRFWPAFIAAAGMAYAVQLQPLGARGACALILALLWALRLCAYITRRNWGHGEDRRYAQMRARHGAAFRWRSLYLVFGLQGALAWIVSAPLLAAAGDQAGLKAFDGVAIALTLSGIAFEAVADAQLAAFRRDPAQRNRVMDRGLWAYTRHPNYFGEACVWWGLGLLGSGGAWWSLLSPLLMTILLLRVSGVSLLEKDIDQRRPGYRDYIARTNAFWPGPRRRR